MEIVPALTEEVTELLEASKDVIKHLVSQHPDYAKSRVVRLDMIPPYGMRLFNAIENVRELIS